MGETKMRFTTFKGEKTVNELATRLFRIQGRGSQAATKQATDALLAANPQLKDLSKLPAGSLIAVPDTAPPIAAGEETTSLALVRSSAAESIQAAFDALQHRLSDIETSALAVVRANTDSFQTAEIKTAMKTAADANVVLPGEPPNLDTLVKDTKEIFNNVQAAQGARKKVGAQLRPSLTAFVK
jgi:hypothetical protein